MQPSSWLDLAGQFSFSQPSLDLTFTEALTGNFVRARSLAAFTDGRASMVGEALRPHPSGNLTAEVRPVSRLRIVQSWFKDRFHISSNRLLLQNLTGVTGLLGTAPPAALEFSDEAFRILSSDYNRYQTEALVEVHSRVTLRSGYRLVSADALVPAPILSSGGTQEGRQRHHVGLGGVRVRARGDLNLHLDLEASSGDSVYFRTGPLDYRKVKMRGRYTPRSWLSVNGTFSLFKNNNDQPDIDLSFRSHETSFSVLLTPREGRRVSLALDYMHSVLDSDVLILLTPFFERDRSLYLQDTHYAGVFCNLALAQGARVSFGGTLLVSDGNRPTRFYQPRAELFVPLRPGVDWTTEWRWYGFSQELYRFENFTSHLLSVGLRLTL